MTRYADPQRCPDCGSPIAYAADACATCHLPLRGAVAQELYTTLSHADALLVRLRASLATVPVGSGAAVDVAPTGLTAKATEPPPMSSVAAPSLTPAATTPMPLPQPAAMKGTSAPKILLALGAGCLLVAALVFLAVTWSVMGVGGRTATLVAFTGIAGGITAVVAHRGLRGAVEALGLVTLGLLALDVAGADNSGWLGNPEPPTFLVILGSVVGAAALGACQWLRRTPSGAFTSGEVVAAIGAGLIALGLGAGEWGSTGPRLLLATVVALALVALVDRLRLVVATMGAALVAALSWAGLALHGLVEVADEPTVAHTWGELAAWPLLAAAALAAALIAITRVPLPARQLAASVAVAVAVTPVVVPVFDEGPTPATVALLVVLALAAAVLWLAPKPWSLAAGLTAVASGLWAGLVTLVLGAVAAGRLAEAAAEPGRFADNLPSLGTEVDLAPWLLAPCVAGLVLLAEAASRVIDRRLPLERALPFVVVITAVATAALYPLPIWAFVAAGGLAGAAFAFRNHPVYAAALLAAAVLVGLHAPGLTALALGAVLVSAGWVHVSDVRDEVQQIAGLVGALALAWSVWAWGDVLDRPGTWVAAVGIVVVAAAGLVVRGGGIEIGAAVGMFGLFVAGGAAAPESELASWVAVYLTLAGAGIVIHALLHEDRRELGWVGGVLLAAATWVRLADLGVNEPEPYTLPSAAALLVVGLLHLRRHPDTSTLKALSPGLCLALVPSLLWVLDDPESLRAVLLGVACVALVVAGAQGRWAAPVVYGGSVLALVVLRVAGPHIEAGVPRWVLLGFAGALLVTLGVTWEQRVRQSQQVLGYVRGLR